LRRGQPGQPGAGAGGVPGGHGAGPGAVRPAAQQPGAGRVGGAAGARPVPPAQRGRLARRPRLADDASDHRPGQLRRGPGRGPALRPAHPLRWPGPGQAARPRPRFGRRPYLLCRTADGRAARARLEEPPADRPRPQGGDGWRHGACRRRPDGSFPRGPTGLNLTGHPKGITMFSRRDFLKASLQTSTLVALAPTVPGFLAHTARAAAPARDGRVLVVVQLDGGNDGINTVVPFKDEGYPKHRKALRLPADRLLKIDKEVGLNPAMRDAAKLLESGRLAIVQGVGYPNPSRSHFKSMAIWHSANVNLPKEDV